MPNLNTKLLGCSAETRPSFCRYESNICCLHCEHVVKCTEDCKSIAFGVGKIKTLPCTPDVVEELNENLEGTCYLAC